jgi:RNA polymerase sigma-70 factor (ECF subfamily)
MSEAVIDKSEERGLIAAASAGDERAFRRLVDPYRAALQVHCYRMLGSPHDAEDLVQEALLRAWRGLENFETRSSVKTWLYRIATNACLDELERRPRRPEPVEPFPDSQLEEIASPAFDPAARYAIREGMELALLTAIQELPGRQRATLILRDVLGWTGPEVAELLDSTVAAVNSALQRARATIDGELPAGVREPAGEDESELLRRYIEVWERTDIDGLVELLREDATLRMPPQRSVTGAREIAAFFRDVAKMRSILLTPTRANRRPAVLMHRRTEGGELEPHGILVLEMEGERIGSMEAFIGSEPAGHWPR